MKKILGFIVIAVALIALVSCENVSNSGIDPTGLYVQTTDDWNDGGASYTKNGSNPYSYIMTSNWDAGATFPSFRNIVSLEAEDTRGAFLEVQKAYGDGHYNYVMTSVDNGFTDTDAVKITFEMNANFVSGDDCWLEISFNNGGDAGADPGYYKQMKDLVSSGGTDVMIDNPAIVGAATDGGDLSSWALKLDSWGSTPDDMSTWSTFGGTTTDGWKTYEFVVPPMFINDLGENSNWGGVTMGVTFGSVGQNAKTVYFDNLKVEVFDNSTAGYTTVTNVTP